MSLIVTCSRHFEDEASSEMEQILEGLGADKIQIEQSEYSGILLVDAGIDSVEATHRIRELVGDEPWCVRYSHRIIPIRRWVETDEDGIVSGAAELAEAIDPDETYRITVEKRDSDVSSRAIIRRVAELIDGQVSLESPGKIVLVEILGKRTGLSLLRPGDILSVEKEKRAFSE